VDLAASLREAAAEAGLVGMGFCPAGSFPDTRAAIEASVAAGRHGSLRFTYADPVTACDVGLSFPWACSLVVAGYPYLPVAGSPGPGAPGTGRVARFAAADHYAPLREGLGRLAAVLSGAGHQAQVLADDSRLVDRAAAVRAGSAWWGKSSMVLAPRHGPWLLVGSVVTDAPLEAGVPMKRACGKCRACLDACPTGALVSPGVLDARRCLAHWTQAPGIIPRPIRREMGDRWYGCDSCLEACPPGRRLLALSTAPSGRVDLRQVLAADDRNLLASWSHLYIPRRQARFLKRNALVALGNSRGAGASEAVVPYLSHPDRLLRAHAAWALGELGGAAARAALAAAIGSEADSEVIGEMEAGLAATDGFGGVSE
jgi:epoxyqueuosine reductase